MNASTKFVKPNLRTMLLVKFFLVALCSFIPPKKQVKDSIDWRSRRTLSWDDFKANPVVSVPNAALTSTSILINYRYNEQSLDYQLKDVFYAQKSWTKVSSKHILEHEQGHFDISQLFTRKLHKELSEYHIRQGRVDKDVMTIYQEVAKKQNEYQQLYDQETNYSRNWPAQKSWQDKIAKELKDLEVYSNYPQIRN